MVMYLHHVASSQSACAAEQGKHKWRPVGGTIELDSDFITNQERCIHYGKFLLYLIAKIVYWVKHEYGTACGNLHSDVLTFHF